MHQLRLHSPELWVDTCLRDFNGRWLASAATYDGPSLGWGTSPLEALWMALEPFDGSSKSCWLALLARFLRSWVASVRDELGA